MPFSNFQKNDICWYGEEREISKLFSLPSVVVKDSKQRLITSSGLAKPEFYLKKDKSWGFRNRFKRLFRDRIENEFASGVMLQEAGISVVEHLGWGRQGKYSYLATRAFSGETLNDFYERNAGDSEKTKQLSYELVGFLKVFLEKSFYHPDLHGGNILVAEKKGGFHFCFVDVYGVQRRTLSSQKINEMLVFLFSKLSDWSENEKLEIFSEFVPFYENLGGKEILKEVSGAQIERLNKHRRSRISKYLKNSTLCNAWASGDGKIVARKKYAKEKVEAILAKFADKDCEIIKDDKKRKVMRVRLGKESFIVKQFLQPRYIGRWRYDCRSWLNGISLENMGIPVPGHIAWLKSGRTGLLIMEDAGTGNLAESIAYHSDREEQLRLLQEAVRIIVSMQDRGLLHGDLKTTNFILTASNEVKLVDNDDVCSKCPPISLSKRQKNFIPFIEYLLYLQGFESVHLPWVIEEDVASERNFKLMMELSVQK